MNKITVKAAVNSAPAEVSIQGEIGGFGVTSEDLKEQLKNVSGPIIVRIKSEGGDVTEGIEMFEFLRQRGQVETVVNSIAASAATLPFMAGAKRTIGNLAHLMIHNPWSAIVGDAEEMRKRADLLDRFGAKLIAIYSSVTGIAADKVQAMMDAETWMDGAEAKAGGWATDVLDLAPVKASVRPGRYAKTPALILGAEWTAPEAARNAFRKGIQQVEDGKGGDGLEPTTVKEARALASGERPTDFKVRKANAWWARNERFLDAEANSPADVAANLWGGAAGRDWFRALFNELEQGANASVRNAAAPGALLSGDYVSLTFGGVEANGEVVEIMPPGTASGADGSVEGTAEDPAALVEVLKLVEGTDTYEETDITVARLFSTLTRIEEPPMAEEANPISAPFGAVSQRMKTKLLALLGVEASAKETFLASALADLGIKPEAVSAAFDAGQTGFLAEHITNTVNAAKADADKLRPEAALLASVRAKLGAKADADEAAIMAAIEAKVSAGVAAKLAATEIGRAHV